MSAQTWIRMLALLMLFPAMTMGAEVPRLVVSGPYSSTHVSSELATISGSDGLSLSVVGTTDDACSPTFSAPEVKAGEILIQGRGILTILPCNEESWVRQMRVDPLPPGIYKVSVTLDERLYASLSLVVGQPNRQAVLFPGGGLFSIDITFKHPATGVSTRAGMVPFSDQAATFWFFDPKNPEVTVKVLDGRPVNGHFWVFATSMTTVEFTIEISRCLTVDEGPCTSKSYHSPAGKNLDVVDLSFGDIED